MHLLRQLLDLRLVLLHALLNLLLHHCQLLLQLSDHRVLLLAFFTKAKRLAHYVGHFPTLRQVSRFEVERNERSLDLRRQ